MLFLKVAKEKVKNVDVNVKKILKNVEDISLKKSIKTNVMYIYHMNKDELVSNIKQWISLDEEIKNLQRQIKEKRNEKKENTETLVRIMRDNEIDCFELDSNGGKLIYTKQKIKKSLSKKYLMTCLMQYFKEDSQQAKQVSNFILNNREEKIKENIRRKVKK